MFENETSRVLNSYNESVKFLKKLKNLAAPYEYGQPLHDVVFYNCIPRVYSMSSLEYDTHNALANILKKHNIARIGRDTRALYNYGSDNLTIKEHVKNINSITPETFFYNAFYYGAYNEAYGSTSGQSFKNNVFEDIRAHEKQMFLILDCLNLLDNPEPITYDQRQAIYKVLKDCNTFIFKGCKVTLYNNGRLIVKFSDSELFTRFKNKAEKAIKAVKKDLTEAKACND